MTLAFNPWVWIEEQRGSPAKAAKAAKAAKGQSALAGLATLATTHDECRTESEPKVSTRVAESCKPAPCQKCRDLDAKGVVTIFCSGCGYETPRPPERPVRYARDWIEAQLTELPKSYREHYAGTLERLLRFGWVEEQASSVAFARMLRKRPDAN